MNGLDFIDRKIQQLGPTGYRAAARTAVVAGIFCLLVIALMAGVFLRASSLDPVENAEMKALKAKLGESVAAPALKEQIRALDLRLRQTYFRSSDLLSRGGWLLLRGAIVFLVSASYAVTYGSKLPMPQKKPARGEERRVAALGRWAVAGAAVMLVSAGIAAAVVFRERPSQPAEGAADFASNWPRFRGPGGLGVSALANVPARWNGATGEGILWKTRVPLPGQNSPVVWGSRVFLSGATEKRREVYCFDADSGRLLWQRPVETPGSPSEPPEVMDITGFAAPTTATDGKRVFAIFANGDLAAFDFNGKPAWARNLGSPDNHYGHASSLATWRNLLLVQYDQMGGKSALLALDTATGSTVWRAARPVPTSWCSPIVIGTTKGDQVVACGDPWVIAYDPATGSELWRAKCISGEIGPSPAFAAGMVFTANDNASLAAVRVGGSGDVTASHVVWRVKENLPDTSSPLAAGELLFTAANASVACFDAATGELLWEHEFENNFHSSPTLVGDRVYLTDAKGVTHIFRSARTFEPLGTAELGEESDATPAFAAGRIYIRSREHLFCISDEPRRQER